MKPNTRLPQARELEGEFNHVMVSAFSEEVAKELQRRDQFIDLYHTEGNTLDYKKKVD